MTSLQLSKNNFKTLFIIIMKHISSKFFLIKKKVSPPDMLHETNPLQPEVEGERDIHDIKKKSSWRIFVLSDSLFLREKSLL